MKKNPSLKNMVAVLVSIYLISWSFFSIIIFGKNYDIFDYATPAGRLAAITALVVPAVIVYVFMTLWGDVTSLKHFVKKVLDGEQPKKTLLVVGIWLVLHTAFVIIGGSRSNYTIKYVPVALVVAFISYGLAEIAWRGIVFFAFWEHMPFFTACMLAGILNTLYFVPMLKIEGAMTGNFAWFMFFSIYQSIIMGCVYRITHCTAACVVMQTIMRLQMYFYTDLVFGSSKIIMLYLVEAILLAVAAFTLGNKTPGRGWVDYERDDFV